MPTSKECVCCRECPPAVATHPEGCITEHTDFAAICLQPCVLRVAFWALQEEERHPAPGEQKLRFVAYKQFTRWMWRRLGRYNRRVLPACAVARIRQEFPSETYTGYLDAE
ncbi:P2X purinoceptor 7 [Ixodes scapularis]